MMFANVPMMLPDALLFGVGDVVNAMVGAQLWVVRQVLSASLNLALLVTEPLAFYTPAVDRPVLTPISDADYYGGDAVVTEDGVIYYPGLAGPAGIISKFQRMLLIVSSSLLGIYMLVLGLLWQLGRYGSGKHSLGQVVGSLFPALIFTLTIAPMLQMVVEINQTFTAAVYEFVDYDTASSQIFDLLTFPGGVDEFGLIAALLVSTISFFMVVLQLALRYGILIIIAGMAPLLTMLAGFGPTRSIGMQGLKMFATVTFMQFFMAIGLSFVVHIIVALNQGQGLSGAGIMPTWAVAAGTAAAAYTIPKKLSQAGEALDAAIAPMRTATGIAVGAAAAGAGVAAAGAVGAGAKMAGGAVSRFSTSGAARIHSAGMRASTGLRTRSMNMGRSTVQAYGRAVKHSVGMTGLSRTPGDDISSKGAQSRDGGSRSGSRPPAGQPRTGGLGARASLNAATGNDVGAVPFDEPTNGSASPTHGPPSKQPASSLKNPPANGHVRMTTVGTPYPATNAMGMPSPHALAGNKQAPPPPIGASGSPAAAAPPATDSPQPLLADQPDLPGDDHRHGNVDGLFRLPRDYHAKGKVGKAIAHLRNAPHNVPVGLGYAVGAIPAAAILATKRKAPSSRISRRASRDAALSASASAQGATHGSMQSTADTLAQSPDIAKQRLGRQMQKDLAIIGTGPGAPAFDAMQATNSSSEMAQVYQDASRDHFHAVEKDLIQSGEMIPDGNVTKRANQVMATKQWRQGQQALHHGLKVAAQGAGYNVKWQQPGTQGTADPRKISQVPIRQPTITDPAGNGPIRTTSMVAGGRLAAIAHRSYLDGHQGAGLASNADAARSAAVNASAGAVQNDLIHLALSAPQPASMEQITATVAKQSQDASPATQDVMAMGAANLQHLNVAIASDPKLDESWKEQGLAALHNPATRRARIEAIEQSGNVSLPPAVYASLEAPHRHGDNPRQAIQHLVQATEQDMQHVTSQTRSEARLRDASQPLWSRTTALSKTAASALKGSLDARRERAQQRAGRLEVVPRNRPAREQDAENPLF